MAMRQRTVGLVTYVGSEQDVHAVMHGLYVLHFNGLTRSISEFARTLRDVFTPVVAQVAASMASMAEAFFAASDPKVER